MAQQSFSPSITTRSLAIANWAVEVPGFWRSRRFQSGLAAMIFPSQVGEGLIFGLFLGEGFILSYFFLVICWNPWGQKTYCRTLVGRWFPALAVITSQFDPISRYPAATQGHQAERFRKMQAASACVPCNIIQCRCMLWLAVELYQTQRCSKKAKRDNENSVATWQQKTTMESWKVATSLKVCDGLECFVSLTCHVHV